MMNVLWECTIINITRTYLIDYDIRSSQIIIGMRLSCMWTIKWYIFIYISVFMKYVCTWYYLTTHWYTYGMRMMSWYGNNICVNYLRQIHHIRNYKYKLMQLYTINDLITNVNLCHILHINNGDICETQREIVKNVFLR